MRNWSVDTDKFDKNTDTYRIWKLEQLINYGLDGEKINKDELQKYISRLNIDPSKRKLLTLLLASS